MLPMSCFGLIEFGVCRLPYLRIEISTQISGIERHASRNFLIAGVQVKDALISLADPDDFGDLASKRCLRSVAALNVKEVPSGCCLGGSPVVTGRREESTVLVMSVACILCLYPKLTPFGLRFPVLLRGAASMPLSRSVHHWQFRSHDLLSGECLRRAKE